MKKIRSNNGGFRFHEIRTLRHIHVVLGLVLFAGGTLKLYAFAAACQEDDWETMLLAILSEVEVFAGLGLVSGHRPERSRPWAVAIFSGLWASTLYWVLIGRCSSGRFGSLAVNPWFVLLFDTVALALLLKWRPPRDEQAEESSNPLGTIGLAVTALVVFAAGARQQTLVTVAGLAAQGGLPLAEAPLMFRGNSIELEVRTDDQGRFRLPPVRPGQYSVSMSTTLTPSGSKPEMPARGTRMGLGKRQRNRSENGVEKTPQLSELAKRYADMEIISLEVDDCSAGDLTIDFK